MTMDACDGVVHGAADHALEKTTLSANILSRFGVSECRRPDQGAGRSARFVTSRLTVSNTTTKISGCLGAREQPPPRSTKGKSNSAVYFANMDQGPSSCASVVQDLTSTQPVKPTRSDA